MYLLSYFRTHAEALHYALSDDGLTWHALNENRPVLVGEVGSKTLRDPYVFQALDGGYHLLATDGWSSTAIVHATSNDLLRWGPQKLVPVMNSVAHTRNCWAPECFYDVEAAVYRLIWSSTVVPANQDDLVGHRIWSSVTRDFRHFSPPQLFFDPGYNVIDATIRRFDDRYILAFKDERGVNQHGTAWKAIRVAESREASGPWSDVSDLITPALTEGPSLYRNGKVLLMLYDHFLDGHFGIAQSEDGRTWRTCEDPVTFPEGVRHAAVLEIDDNLGQQLRSFWNKRDSGAFRSHD